MKKISLEEHRKLGIEYYDLKDKLIEIIIPLRNAYPDADAKGLAVIDALEAFRSAMDNILCREYPQIPGIEHLYYPGKPGRRRPGIPPQSE